MRKGDEYETVEYSYGIVNTDYLNMRTGAGITFDSMTVLKRNEYIRIFAKIGEWYIVQNQQNQVGTVHSNYITPTNELKASTSNTEIIQDEISYNLTYDENELLSLINTERKKNNLSELKIDKNLQNVARLKANDLVNNKDVHMVMCACGGDFGIEDVG